MSCYINYNKCMIGFYLSKAYALCVNVNNIRTAVTRQNKHRMNRLGTPF